MNKITVFQLRVASARAYLTAQGGRQSPILDRYRGQTVSWPDHCLSSSWTQARMEIAYPKLPLETV